MSLAKSQWLQSTKPTKAKAEFIKTQIWDVLEAEGFAIRSLLILENLHILEKYVPVALLLHVLTI